MNQQNRSRSANTASGSDASSDVTRALCKREDEQEHLGIHGGCDPSRPKQETTTVAKMERAGRGALSEFVPIVRASLMKPRPWIPLAFFVADWAARIVVLGRPTHSTLHDVANMADLFFKVGGMAVLTVWFARTG
jgi:hypothetical protein